VKMNYLPPELQKFNVFLDALPRLEQVVFLYCVLMCEAGKLHMRNIVPGADWSMVFFETLAGKRFHVIKLLSTETQQATPENCATSQQICRSARETCLISQRLLQDAAKLRQMAQELRRPIKKPPAGVA